jgi:light-regulated signal transduction histidine kinase (bacteriophytochrome)
MKLMRAPVAEPAPFFYSPPRVGVSETCHHPTAETDEARIKRFLAIASHDLQSPLRHIAMYAEILLDDLGVRSTVSISRDYLKTIRAKAQAAQGLTKALVDFRGRGASAVDVGDVDVGA